jgi:16S rRNA (cytidine1402-2'-O)-methyltransferase
VERIAGDDRATVLFESAGRTAGTLRDLAGACGADRAAAVCRELTKRHEEVRRGGLGELAEWAEGRELRGEVTIVVAGATAGEGAAEPAGGLETARARVHALVEEGLSRSQAAKQVAAETGLPRRELFRELGG